MRSNAATTSRPQSGPQIVRKDAWVPEALKRFVPRSELGRYVRECLQYLPGHMAAELVDRVGRVVVIESSLGLRHFRGARWTGLLWDVADATLVQDFGVVGCRVVTNAAAQYISDTFIAAGSPLCVSFNYHGIGTFSSAGAELVTETACYSEFGSVYVTNSIRATGVQTRGASANIYRSVGTNTVDNPIGVMEHGLFSYPGMASSSVATMLDRTAFAVVNLASGDSLQSTYELTITAGG